MPVCHCLRGGLVALCLALPVVGKPGPRELIAQEMRACERDGFQIKDLEISPTGNRFRLRTLDAKGGDRLLDLDPADVVFLLQVQETKDGQTFTLQVANREGEGWILVNGERRQGTFDLLPPSPNRERLSRIIAAFHQLLRDEAQEARSRNQLMASVIREIRALETEDFIYKEVEFSADGSSLRVLFKSRTGREELRVMDLATVNFFRARKSGAIQPPSYQVMVETRGRQGTIQVNGRREQGTFPLLPLTTNKHKAEKLASMLETLAGYARP